MGIIIIRERRGAGLGEDRVVVVLDVPYVLRYLFVIYGSWFAGRDGTGSYLLL